ncbi:MAG: hypothetical protein BEN19_08340 [Epulopiscium sp. Nuni2H_MBin003]|nr:MAG: hypothetical protein BEN19_08340 [Epulopiscium sp. Nuni2H_MBin003]
MACTNCNNKSRQITCTTNEYGITICRTPDGTLVDPFLGHELSPYGRCPGYGGYPFTADCSCPLHPFSALGPFYGGEPVAPAAMFGPTAPVAPINNTPCGCGGNVAAPVAPVAPVNNTPCGCGDTAVPEIPFVPGIPEVTPGIGPNPYWTTCTTYNDITTCVTRTVIDGITYVVNVTVDQEEVWTCGGRTWFRDHYYGRCKHIAPVMPIGFRM